MTKAHLSRITVLGFALLAGSGHADLLGGGRAPIIAQPIPQVTVAPATMNAPLVVPVRPITQVSATPVAAKRISRVEFSATPTAKTEEEMLSTYSRSVATVTYADGSTAQYPLSYNSLFKNTDQISMVKGQTYAAGQLYNAKMEPIMDPNGDPVVAETADGTSLLQVGDRLYLVNHWEYDSILANGQNPSKTEGWYSRMPMSMSLTRVEQQADGSLKVLGQEPVDFSPVDGGWIFCFGGRTPWGTHLGGEEDYDLYFVPGEKAYATTQAGLKAMTEVYFGGEKQANPYDYGYPTEVAVKADGSYEVTKHYEMGKGTWEIARFAPDGRTAIYGDDGSYSGLFMFVGDKANDPQAGGTIYAAKWNQTSDKDGGTADIQWIRLGHGTHAEIDAMRRSGLTINDIFEFRLEDPKDSSFRPTRAGSAQTVWLRLKPGMEKAAAFFETRRYAAYLGATTEFTKGEGVTFNDADKKLYYAMSYVQGSMKAEDGGPVDHIRLPENKAGATYTFDLSSTAKATDGSAIKSAYAPTHAYVEEMLLGRPIAADAVGNTADPEFIANTDNIFFDEKMRTLFVGEDSGNHVNNYVWAYNVDTKKLTRILNVAAGGESTGLGVAGVGNHTYITSNNQHLGEWISSQPEELSKRLEAKAIELWGVNQHGVPNYYLRNDVGYIGGLPAIK